MNASRRFRISAARLPLLLAAGAALLAAGPPPARGEHFDILLTLRGSGGFAEATWDTSPPEGGLHPRQVLRAGVGEELRLEWSLRSEFPHGTMKKVLIRLWAAPQEKLGQKAEPPPAAPKVFDNSFTADFLPHHRARGHFHVRVLEPGNYLVRLDSQETLKGHGHEHFAAVDLKVE